VPLLLLHQVTLLLLWVLLEVLQCWQAPPSALAQLHRCVRVHVHVRLGVNVVCACECELFSLFLQLLLGCTGACVCKCM